jgi:hypothetical protein
MWPSISAGVACGSGRVTLKNASVAWVSIRPRSIHRRESERAHEGGSFLDDRANLGRNGDDVLLLNETNQGIEGVAKGLQQVIGGGVVGGEFREYFVGRLRWVELLGDALEFGLVAVQVGLADLEQAVQGDVDHFIVEQFFRVGDGAQAEVAVRYRQPQCS